jgi:hypothetical protein
MKLVQRGDDGIPTDIRLGALLQRHRAQAAFNVNACLNERERRYGWPHIDSEPCRLALDSLARFLTMSSLGRYINQERMPHDIQ